MVDRINVAFDDKLRTKNRSEIQLQQAIRAIEFTSKA
jgi:hypothetical protein